MRLWHEALIPYLPRQQLLGQHRECCALRGAGWGKKHATVNYVFEHPYMMLYTYHLKVMVEMSDRGYKVAEKWWQAPYRGKKCDPIEEKMSLEMSSLCSIVYPEHNAAYLKECLDNLEGKGIHIDMGDVK